MDCLLPNNIIAVIQSWSKRRRYRSIFQNVAKVIGFAFTVEYFTKKEVMHLLLCNDETAIKYIHMLDELEILKQFKRLKYGYTLKKCGYLSHLYTFLLTNLVCPRMLDDKSPIKGIFKKKHGNIKESIKCLSAKKCVN